MANENKLVNLQDLKAVYDTQYDIVSQEWNSSTTYNAGDYCIYNGKLWRSKINNNTGNTPPTSSTNSYWTRCTKGIAGQTKAIVGEIAEDYVPGKVYHVGDYVSYDRKFYRMSVQPLLPQDEFNENYWDDVKVVNDLNQDIVALNNAIHNHLASDGIKNALLACFENVAWGTPEGQSYYDALNLELYPPQTLVSITAVYTQSRPVYDTTPISALRGNLIVTANYSYGESERVHAYLLSGTLTVGTSVITVYYGGKVAAFTVNVTDAALLYALPQATTFNGNNSGLIDTNVVLFPSDRDLTIVMDILSDTPHNFEWICWYGTVSSPYRGLSVRYRNNSYGTGYTVLATSESPVPSSYRDDVRNRFVVRKLAGSKAQILCYNNEGGLSSETTRANAVVVPYNTLWIGGVDGNSTTFEEYNFKGTIYDLKVYSRYFDDEEAYAYLDMGASS